MSQRFFAYLSIFLSTQTLRRFSKSIRPINSSTACMEFECYHFVRFFKFINFITKLNTIEKNQTLRLGDLGAFVCFWNYFFR